jgi:uncharacterized protein YxjI
MSYLIIQFLALYRPLRKKGVDTILEKPFLKKELNTSTNIDYIKFFNQYNIYNENGELFASITYEKSSGQRLQNLFDSGKTKSHTFKLKGLNGNIIASVQRSNSLWRKHFRIFDKNGRLAFTICPKIKFNRVSFNVINADEMHVAKIIGNSSNTSFAMHDIFNHVIAIIHKKNIHYTFCTTEFADLFDKNVLLATAICIRFSTGAYK